MDKKTDVPLGIGTAVDVENASKDASVSSDGGQSGTGIKTESKFDVSLIKTILGEMKSEFNRDLDLVTSVKPDDEIKKKETRSSLTTDKKPKEDVSSTKNSNIPDSSRVVRSRRSSESSSLKISTKVTPVSLAIKNTNVKDESKETSKESCKDICKTISQDVTLDVANAQPQRTIPTIDIKNEIKEVSPLTVASTDTTKDNPVVKAKIVKTTPLKNIVQREATEATEPAVLPKDRVAGDGLVDISVSKDSCQPKIVSKVMPSSESKETSLEGPVISKLPLKQESSSTGKPRIVITLKTTDDTTDGTKKLKSKVSHAEAGNDEMWTVKVDSRLDFSTQLPAGKRSLRSQTAPKSSSEPEGVKRSARRRSKDLPRESVLQSAIARKEKSFSLGQSDEKPGRSPKLRSPLSIPIDKSPKSSESRRPLIKTSKSDINNVSVNFELLKVDSSASAETPVKNAIRVKQELDSKVARDPSIMLAIKSAPSSSQGLAYTKTGKRRYKPYKGLRYSLTSGSITRRSKVTPRTRTEESPETNNSSESLLVEVPDASNDATKVGARSGSPLVDEAHQDQQPVEPTLKRKVHPDLDCSGGDESKRARQDTVPSPSPGDSMQVPAKPESTAISSGAGTAALCLCQRRSQLFVSTTAGTAVGDIYCQAVDSLDDRLVGCCNSIVMPEVRMLRPSKKVPYLILCDVHTQRLLRHNCCPGCGVFCTQGKFVRCSSKHFYHRDCQLPGDICPHCGDTSPPEDSMLFFKSFSTPVFVPQQKPVKKLPSAKMGFGGLIYSDPIEKFDTFDSEIDEGIRLPFGREVSALGLSPTVDKDKLESLLNFANNVPSNPSVRYTIKSLIQASKTGNAERLISALASGLSPNTIFGDQSQSCLHLASNSGSIATVHVLVQAGAELDVMDKDQYTPLMLATLGSNNAVVKYLVKAGASVTLRGNDGQTALHLAAKSGNLEACHYLLSVANVSSSYINSEDDGGWTPLVWAAEHCHTPVAKFLLERRADPLVRDSEQNVALHWAAFSGSVDISEMLLNYGCDVNSVNVHGDSPLHIGARQNMYHCVLLLLMRGARVAVKNKAGDSPVDCCSVKPSDCHTVISLNMQLQAITNHPARRLLTNDISRGKEINPVQCVNNEDNEGEPTDFIYVSENCYTSNIVVDRTITSLQSCRCTDKCTSSSCLCANISLKCWYDSEGKLLSDFNFADPPMLFECNQGCACNRITCHNRVVQHGLTCRFQLFRTREKGWGVRTLRLISKGSYVCEYIGEIISDCEADHREDDSYLFDLDNRDGETFCIDARHYGNVARFINHMCVPNLIPVRVFIDHQDLHFPRIAFFANRDIEPDEELGFDYGEKFWIIKCKSFTCTCGAEQCRYSDTTIQQTLDNYNKRLQLEESLQS